MPIAIFRVDGNHKHFDLFNGERANYDQIIMSGSRPFNEEYNQVHRKYGYLICDDFEENIVGVLGMVPYSVIGYPTPAFPAHWRPNSNLFHATVLGYRGKYSAIHLTRAIIQNSDFGKMEKPITITAELATEYGKRFFIDVWGASTIGEINNHPVAALTFLRREDVIINARRRVRAMVRTKKLCEEPL